MINRLMKIIAIKCSNGYKLQQADQITTSCHAWMITFERDDTIKIFGACGLISLTGVKVSHFSTTARSEVVPSAHNMSQSQINASKAEMWTLFSVACYLRSARQKSKIW